VELIERTVRVHILQDEEGAESGRLEGWRANVAYITGEENPVAQGTAVRCACANLSEAYKQLDETRAEQRKGLRLNLARVTFSSVGASRLTPLRAARPQSSAAFRFQRRRE
jgi:hypothetical protein